MFGKGLLRALTPKFVRNSASYQSRQLFEFNRLHGEYELSILDTLVKRDRPSIDVGANAGIYTYFLSKLTPQVHSFEPNPTLAAHLRQLRLKRVQIHETALSDTTGTALLRLPVFAGKEDPGQATIRMDALGGMEIASTYSVDMKRLDDMGLGDVGFIKIDVEGHEEALLHGALQTITTNHPTLLIEIEERHNEGGLKRIDSLLSGMGYRSHFYYREKRIPVSDFDVAVHQIFDEERIHIHRREYVNNFVFEFAR